MEQNVYFNRGIEIVRRLNELTYEAYLVGGVVRDYLLQLPFHDIDIATSATPDEVLAAFPHGDREFYALGVITLRENGFTYEITTFKTEEYTSVRKPSRIHYSKRLQEDIPRRDFTINGLALSANLKLIDLCEGKKDLDRKIIRTIGKAKKRFKEDPLRILRAFSLSARLGFKIERKTAEGIKAMRDSLGEISNYKITAELKKIFSAPYALKAIKQMKKMRVFDGLTTYGLGLARIYRHFDELSTIEKFTVCFKCLGYIPDHTGLTHQELVSISKLLEISDKIVSEPIQPLLLYDYGLEHVLSGDRINKYALRKYKSQAKVIEKVHKETIHISTSDLAFKGHHLVELAGGQKGPFIGEIIETLKKQIILGLLPNDHEILKAETYKLLGKYQSAPKQENLGHPILQAQQTELENTNQVLSDELSEKNQEQLFNQYRLEYNQLFQANLASISDLETLSQDEQEAIKNRVSATVHAILVTKNPKYKIFEVTNDKI